MPISAALGSSALLPAGLGFRNVLINGNMAIDQRNAGVASNSSGYTLDRWTCFRTVANGGTFSTQRVADAPEGFTYSLKASNVTNSTASTVWIYQQLIEGFNVQNFALGSTTPKAISLSFWVKSTTTGTYGGCLSNGSNRSYVFTYTINTQNIWEYKTIYLVGDNTGTWAKDSTVGLKVLFSIGTGGNIGTANTWAAGDLVKTSGSVGLDNVSSASWQITGVQLEQNTQPTPFEQRPIGVELALCQRYLQLINGVSTVATYSAGVGYGIWRLVTTMRATPAIPAGSITTGNCYYLNSGGSFQAVASVIAFGGSTNQSIYVIMNHGQALNASVLINIDANIQCSAEL